ncbi:MAG: MerR family transcriptional regulator [Acidimicrobiia bacterium]|nr:MerR family transcriptional regulator [Acidimicrobiia bacterium]
METTFHIGEVADLVGLSRRTIREYERVGVVQPAARSSGGFRLYSAHDISRLHLVKSLKPLSLSGDELRDFVDGPHRREVGGEVDAAAREGVVERLERLSALAARRCDELRAQLATATSTTAQLRRHVRRARSARCDPT